MRYEDFIQKEGEIIDSKRRDHLYAVSNIAVKNWLFIYQNIDASTEKTKYWGWTQKNFTCLDYQTNINNLLRNKVKVLPQELVFLINKIDVDFLYKHLSVISRAMVGFEDSVRNWVKLDDELRRMNEKIKEIREKDGYS